MSIIGDVGGNVIVSCGGPWKIIASVCRTLAFVAFDGSKERGLADQSALLAVPGSSERRGRFARTLRSCCGASECAHRAADRAKASCNLLEILLGS